MLIFSVSFQFLRMTSIKRFHHYGHQKVYLRPIVNTLLGYGHNREHVQKRGRAGIEPATSRTQSENHTTRPTAHSIAAKHARRDSNPQPPDSKSDALSVAPRAPVHTGNVKQTQFHRPVLNLKMNTHKCKSVTKTRQQRDSNSRGIASN